MSVGAKIIIYSVLYFIIFGCSETANDNSDGQKNYNPFTADMVPKVKPQELKKLNNLKNYIFLKPGEFWMGSPETEIGRKKDEIKHLVQITKPFWMSKFELTNEEWNKNIPLSLQKGSPIYKLAVEDFKKICIEGNFIEGNYTIRGYEQTSRNKSSTSSFYFEEVEPNIGTMGNWERKEKKGKSFLINDKVLPSYYKILDFLKKNNILQVGLVGQKTQ